jgi:hypothetical protein
MIRLEASRNMSDNQQIDPNLSKIQQTMQELNLKYTIIPGKPGVLVRFTVDNQVSFTLIIEARPQGVSLRMPLAPSQNIPGLTRNELTNRLLNGNTRISIVKFGLDQTGNVGLSSELPMEDFTAASLTRQVKAAIAAMLYFYNEIRRPLGLRCGQIMICGSQHQSLPPKTELESFEIEVFDVTHNLSTKVLITRKTTVTDILNEVTTQLNLPSKEYLLVHNSRKLDREHAAETAESLLIKQGDALDIISAA